MTHEKIDVIYGYQFMPDNSQDPEIKKMWEDHFKFWNEINKSICKQDKIDTIKDLLIITGVCFIASIFLTIIGSLL